ncbi:hypothetical protein [Pedobacter mucosus]|uniref:hypothetical protein n=1 Tax=Pedobacter mucosus TaxID=2895286 RepID=UPI001EE4B065|nr:hypothetical protein [Pedobacter mucosus]UKT63043.1 hypothetical protein LOK61_14850 [Pedobacter mucosus]
MRYKEINMMMPLEELSKVKEGDIIKDALGNFQVVEKAEVIPYCGKLLFRIKFSNYNIVIIK